VSLGARERVESGQAGGGAFGEGSCNRGIQCHDGRGLQVIELRVEQANLAPVGAGTIWHIPVDGADRRLHLLGTDRPTRQNADQQGPAAVDLCPFSQAAILYFQGQQSAA
jgi:hypothetical protein